MVLGSKFSVHPLLKSNKNTFFNKNAFFVFFIIFLITVHLCVLISTKSYLHSVKCSRMFLCFAFSRFSLYY